MDEERKDIDAKVGRELLQPVNSGTKLCVFGTHRDTDPVHQNLGLESAGARLSAKADRRRNAIMRIEADEGK